MDKELDKSFVRKKNRKALVYIAGTAGALLAGIWLLRQALDASVKRSDLIVGEVREGEIENTVSASGVVVPSSEVVLTSPLSAKIRRVVTENGAAVAAGQPIVELDPEYAGIELQRLEEELRLKDNNVMRLRLELEKNIREIELDDKIKDLQLRNLEAVLKDAKRLQTIGGMTQEEVEKAAQNLSIALLEKKKLENELRYRKESIASSVLNEQIQASIQKKRLDELAKKLQNAVVTAHAPGVITWLDDRVGNQVQEGDPVVRLANISSFSINGEVSDLHAGKIKTGMPVKVQVDNLVENGEIEQILPAVENNVLQFKVKLQKADSDKLRPKMKLPVRIVTGTRARGVYIPNGPGIGPGSGQQLFVLEQDRAVARAVELGFRTSDKIEVVSGLKPGEKVILSDMSPYAHKSRLRIK